MIIAITNHKGGTGKTTTAANLASGLTLQGKRVLLIDLDPQANLSYTFGILHPQYDAVGWMMGDYQAGQTIVGCGPVDIIPSSTSYYDREIQFAGLSKENDHLLLHKALLGFEDHYDFVLVDCPPSLSLLTENALLAADAVLIPTLFEVLPILGIEQILDFIERVKREDHPLHVLGVIGVNVDERRQLTYEVLEYIRDHHEVHVFNNYIRTNVKAAEAPSFAKTVVEYAPASNSARDYLAFVNEFLAMTERMQTNKAELTI